MPGFECLSASASITNACNILYTRGSSSASSKEIEIRTRSQNHEIVPSLPIVPFVVTPLLHLISSSYNALSQGDSQIVYATSSIGKTTACQAFIHKVLP